MRSNLLYRRNPLAFPSGVAPGIDPAHRASQGLRFSGIAANKNFISLNQGVIGTIVGTPTFSFDGAIGPSFNCTTGTAQHAAFTGQSTAADPAVTVAVIVRLASVANINQFAFATSNNFSTGVAFDMALGNNVNLTGWGGPGQVNSGILLAAGIPYMVIGSINAATANFLVLRLDTGAIVTSTVATGGTPLVAPNGTYLVGDDNIGDTLHGKIAAAMTSAQFMSLSEMRQWASDPWAFWYPRQTEKIGRAAAGGFLAAWAMNSNLPVIGTGTY